jgi:6-phosphogluconolactonase (cycloisomerase 2 family)
MRTSNHRAAFARIAAAGAGLAIAATAVFASPAQAVQTSPHGVVFVETDSTVGNSVIAYDAASDGTLTQAGSYATGGLGGVLAGSVVDHTASQGSLVLDRLHGLLYTVNAGSNTVSVFDVHGDRLMRRQVISSGGTFPVSIAVHGNLVYVLNARDGGSIQGYLRVGSTLVRISAWQRGLGLDVTLTPEFTHTPAQIAFTPDGSQLVLTTKANGNAIDVYAINASGAPAARPTVNVEPDSVPFAFAFDAHTNLVAAETGTNSIASFTVHQDGTLTAVDRAATGQAATCWVATDGTHFYTSNAGSATVSGYTDHGDGTLHALGNAATDVGTVDAAASSDGKVVYVQTGANGIVDAFRIAADGGLTAIGSVTVPDAVGGEGIAAS